MQRVAAIWRSSHPVASALIKRPLGLTLIKRPVPCSMNSLSSSSETALKTSFKASLRGRAFRVLCFQFKVYNIRFLEDARKAMLGFQLEASKLKLVGRHRP